MHVPALYRTDKVKHQLIVKEKLFSWSGDDFKVKTMIGEPFRGGIKMKGKVWALRDQMTLLDGSGRPIAVCLRKFDLLRQIFKIYTVHPVYQGQRQSGQQYEGQALYTYAEVKRVPLSIIQEVKFEGDDGPATMTITRSSFIPKKRTVFYRRRPAALMEGGNWSGNYNSYKITIGPGVDPCLIICLAAICDEMDEDK
jgi:hypothetical protein